MWGNEESEKSVLQRLRRSSIILIATLAMAATFAQSASAIELPKYSLSFGSSGSGTGQFGGIPGIATDAEGAVFAVDYDHGRVEKFSPSGEYISQFGSTGSEAGQLLAPNGLAIDSSGIIYVTEYSNNRIQEFNSKGESIGYLGKQGPGTENGQVQNPTDITIDSEGNFWVSEDHSQVQEFNSNGEFVRKFGSFGTGNGQFHIPSGVAVDGSGNVWVADFNNNRVQKFNSKGEFLLAVSSLGAGHGSFSHPTDLVVDPSDRIWVAEGGHVVALSDGGEYLGEFSPSEGSPSAVALDATGYFWVGGSHHVEKWATPRTLNPNWRIEGSSLAELEAWAPYESSGTLQIESIALKKEATITCAESGSGTLGFEETMSLSECEVELGGEKQPSCEGASETPISLDGEFQVAEEVLTTLDFGNECAVPATELTVGSAFDFEAGSTADELATTMSGGEVHFGTHEAQLTLSSTWQLGGKYEGQKFAYAGDFESLNPDWRIEGSSLAELEAWAPYESSGTLQIESIALKKEATITCAESGSGTLGFEETMSLSECEVELGGEKQPSCEGASETPISLDGEFQVAEEVLTTLDFGNECAVPATELTVGSAFDFEAGSTADELATTMSGGEVHFGTHEAQLTLSSTWQLGGKYEGQKFAYAGDFESLNPDWRIEGSSLAELEAWTPYESSGTLQIESIALKKEATITCAESGSGTLGFEETMSLSECEVELGGEYLPECEAHGDGPIALDGEFKGTKEPLTEIEFGTGECPIPTTELTVGSAFDFEAGSTADELATTMSGGEVHFGTHEAQLTLSSTWQLGGKYSGSEFSYL